VDDVEPRLLAEKTPLFSGADLRALVEAATDLAIDEALARGADVDVSTLHFAQALRRQRPTTLAWLQTAKTFVEFGDRGEAYADVARYLDSADARSVR
jgi:SpoVK/Ycf46/Vps4 family AAA+-type ATPase